MKILILNIFTLLLISSCNFEEAAEDAGDGLFSGQKEITNTFVRITSSDQTYIEGENIDLVFKHPSKLTVTGTPRIEIDIDGSTEYATYLTGSSTQNLTFRYTVQSGDNDSDGIELASTLDLNGGSIQFSNAGSLVDADFNYETDDEVQLSIDTISPSLTLVTPPNPTT